MSGKNQYPLVFNWQSSSPITNFLPLPANQGGSSPSGTASGTMSGTNAIYSQIIDTSRMDVTSIELTYTGTPTGTFEVYASNSGRNFYPITFNPALTQPSGAAGGYLINLAFWGFKYLMLKYTNASGSGTLTAYAQLKDWN